MRCSEAEGVGWDPRVTKFLQSSLAFMALKPPQAHHSNIQWTTHWVIFATSNAQKRCAKNLALTLCISYEVEQLYL